MHIIAADDIPGRSGRSANRVTCRPAGDENAIASIAPIQHASDVRADIVPQNDVARAAAVKTIQFHSAVIAGNKVARGRRSAADRVVVRASIDENARAVAQ